jgi:SEC-C motif-containing protein
MNLHLCFCHSGLPFEQCCEPYLQGLSSPDTPEQLMRSRYSAYVTSNYQYVLDTYTVNQRKSLILEDLQQGGNEAQWLRLDVLNAHTHKDDLSGQVEFVAYYQVNDTKYKLHERSTFYRENNLWRYDNGTLFEDGGLYKPQRNDLCLCGSGKKYKKCCL